jgi:DNA-binding response OmpR family regulator
VVLIADSYDDARSPIARYLDRYGFDVIEAASADEAARRIAERRPHAVLSGLQGDEAGRLHLRLSDPALPPPPIVIVMISGGDESIPAEVTGVLEKPFSLRPMLDELRRELRRHPPAGAIPTS